MRDDGTGLPALAPERSLGLPLVRVLTAQLHGTLRVESSSRGTEIGLRIFVFLTSYSDEQTVTDAQAAFPYGFVVKPYCPAQLHAAIQLALARRDAEGRRRGGR